MKIKVEKRDVIRKRLNTIREEKKVPAVVYGPSFDSLSVSINAKEFESIFKDSGYSKLVDLDIEGKTQKAIIKEVQTHPVTRKRYHVSFYAVDMNAEIEANIPIETVGVSPAVKSNVGFLEMPFNTLTVKCLPGDLPQNIEVDISTLVEIGDSITLESINISKKVEVQGLEPSDVLASIAAPQKEEIVEEGSDEVSEGSDNEGSESSEKSENTEKTE